MKEKDCRKYLNGLLKQGRADQLSGVTDAEDPELQQSAKFLGGHALLPENYDQIPKDKIIKMGELLLRGEGDVSIKEAIIMILAHHPSKEALNILRKYNKRPDKGLEFFAQMALDECQCWNE